MEVKFMPRYQLLVTGQEIKILTHALRGTLRSEQVTEAYALASAILITAQKATEEQEELLRKLALPVTEPSSK